MRPPPKVRMREGWSIVGSDWFNFGFIHLLELFLEIKKIAQNNEKAGITKCGKTKILFII